MTIKRMDNVLIVVQDIELVKAFFTKLGMDLAGETIVSGDWVDKVLGLKGVSNKIAMMQTPDGHNQIELAEFISPLSAKAENKNTPVNKLGIRRIMFAVDNIDETLSNLAQFNVSLVGEIAKYNNLYRLCYIRGPEDILIGLAEQLDNG